MITDFRISRKTKRPGCCDWDCCGNHFGRITRRSKWVRIHNINRMKLTRRYAKRVERAIIRRDILNQLNESYCD